MAESAAQRPELRAAFDKFDRDGNGFIDEAEFAELVASLGIHLTPEKIQIAFVAIDVNGNEHIDFGEFAVWWQRPSAK